MADANDIPDLPNDAAATQSRPVGGESETLAQRPDPAPGDPQRATFPTLCQHPRCTKPAEPGSAYCSNPLHTGSDSHGIDIEPPDDPDPTRPGGVTDLTSSHDNGDDEIAQLRRDVHRLEGKIDALLAALEVDDGDE